MDALTKDRLKLMLDEWGRLSELGKTCYYRTLYRIYLLDALSGEGGYITRSRSIFLRAKRAEYSNLRPQRLITKTLKNDN